MPHAPIGIIVVVFIMLEILVVFVPLSLMSEEDSSTIARQSHSAGLLMQQAADKIGPTLEVISLSLLGLQGFVAASLKTIPDRTLTPAARIQSIPRFAEFAASLVPALVAGNSNNPSSNKTAGFSFELHSGGVLAEVFPSNLSATELPRDDFVVDADRTWAYINAKGIPKLHTNLATGEVVGGVAIFSATADITNWWGNAISTLRLGELLSAINIEGLLAGSGLAWCLVLRDGARSTAIGGTPGAHVRPNGAVVLPGRGQLLVKNVFFPVANQTLFFVFRPTALELSATPDIRAVIIIVGSFCSLAAVALANILYFIYAKEYTGRDHAPKHSPFAMTTVAIENGEELAHVMTADEWSATVNHVNARFRHAIQRHRAYISQSLLQYCHIVVTRSIDASIHLSYDFIEDLVRDPITFRALDGSTRKIRVLIACHWCEDVAPIDAELNYVGPDMLYGVRLFRGCALANRVVLSRAALDVASSMRTCKVAEEGTAMLHDMSVEQEWFVVYDPHSKLLIEALQTPNDDTAPIVVPHLGGEGGAGGGGGLMVDVRADNPLVRRSEGDPIAMRSSDDEANPSSRQNSVFRASKRLVRFDPTGILSKNVEAALHRCFASPGELLELDYDDVGFTLGTVYCAIAIFLESFATKERQNILRRLAIANSLPFGPQFVEELSVRCLCQSKLVFFQQELNVSP